MGIDVETVHVSEIATVSFSPDSNPRTILFLFCCEALDT